jgi:predicted phosphate transport protein (TIGR00153 family)
MKKKRRKNDYYALLEELVEYIHKAASFLSDTMNDYNIEFLSSGTLDKMHDIEHSADIKLQELTSKLAREFITPIERQDILAIAQRIDDVTDAIEDVLMRLYMYNIRELRNEAFEFVGVIMASTEVLMKIMAEFANFRRSNDIRAYIIKLNALEEEGDAIYMRAIRRLYLEEQDPIAVIAWTEIFRRLEGCCDDFEDVSQEIEYVLMKNT